MGLCSLQCRCILANKRTDFFFAKREASISDVYYRRRLGRERNFYSTNDRALAFALSHKTPSILAKSQEVDHRATRWAVYKAQSRISNISREETLPRIDKI